MTSRDDLPLAVRALQRASEVGVQLRLLPSQEQTLAKPVATRQAIKAPRLLTRPRPRGVRSENVVIDARGGSMRVRLHRPDDALDGPGVLYLHGGGFVMGGLDACDWLCAELAVRTSLVVAAPEYRLAPDHRYPAALEDCVDALRWFGTQVDPAQIAVAGDSAGGNLTAVLALMARDGEAPAVQHQTLIYPFLDSTLKSASWTECAGGGLDVTAGELMLACYVGETGWDDPLVSPLHASDLRGVAAALIITADRDVLRDDGFAYADRLVTAGVAVRHTNYVRMPHGFLSIPRVCGIAPTQALAEMASEITAAVGTKPA